MPTLNTKFAIIATLCIGYSGLTGCGTKGPLYIPEQRYPQKNDTQTIPEQKNPAAPSPTKEY
jgi:predicted small lipoprotein YifL